MATIQNDIDILLQAESPRTLTTIQEQLAIGATSNTFTVDNTGTPTPSTILFTALPISIPGNVTWSCTGGTLSSISSNEANLQYVDMSGSTATVTANITDQSGTTFTASQVITNNLPNSNAQIYAYIRSATVPTTNPGTVTYTFATASVGSMANGWTATVPSGTNQLWTVIAVAAGNHPTFSITSGLWSTPQQLGGVGPAGTTGASGNQTVWAYIYQWAASIPAGPAGTPTYTWSTNSFGAAPSGWSLTPGSSGPAGYTLWQGGVLIQATAGTATTNFNWSSISIVAVGASGATGTTGPTGATGNSARTGYNCVTGGVGALGSSPTTYTTTGSSTFPPQNTWGGAETIAWQGTVPSIAAGQSLWQTDGIYSTSTNNTVWGIPYLSSLKVGSLSAISASLGTVTSGTIIGNLIETSTSGQRVTINESSNNTINFYTSSGTLEGQFGAPSGSGFIWANSTTNTVPGISGTNSAAGGVGIYAETNGTSSACFYAQSDGGNGNAYVGTGGAITAQFINHGSTALKCDGAIQQVASGGAANLTNVLPIADNTYTSGAASLAWSNIYSHNALTVVSDRRRKLDVKDGTLGLSFINDLHYVTYRAKIGGHDDIQVSYEECEYPNGTVYVQPIYEHRAREGKRIHHGLIAQEVKEALDKHNVVDAAFWVSEDVANPDAMQALRYEQLIPVLIKAVQELSAKVTELEGKFNA